jgi:hypothetical protein
VNTCWVGLAAAWKKTCGLDKPLGHNSAGNSGPCAGSGARGVELGRRIETFSAHGGARVGDAESLLPQLGRS